MYVNLTIRLVIVQTKSLIHAVKIVDNIALILFGLVHATQKLIHIEFIAVVVALPVYRGLVHLMAVVRSEVIAAEVARGHARGRTRQAVVHCRVRLDCQVVVI